jgi:hypothetical protein
MNDSSRAILVFALLANCVSADDGTRNEQPESSQHSTDPQTNEGKAIEHGFVQRIHKDADGHQAKYSLFAPFNYNGEKNCR